MLEDKILRLVNDLHSGQYRKNRQNNIRLPYIFHPMDVVKTLYKHNCLNEDIYIAGLCHDLFEDTEIPEESLKSEIGEKAFNIVKELTFECSENDKNKKAQLKEEYMKSFKDKSIEALIIKLVDRYCNVMDFNITDKIYAGKYALKARELFGVYKQRENEILKLFPKNTLAKLYSEIETVYFTYYLTTPEGKEAFGDIL